MGENPELIAMARRIAAETKVGAAPYQILRGDWDNTPVVRAALAAIIETQERDAALAERYIIDGNPIHPDIPADAMAPDARMIAHTTCQHIAEAIRSFRRDGE